MRPPLARVVAIAAAAAAAGLACVSDGNVSPHPLTSLAVVPSVTEVVLDTTVQLTAVARDPQGVAFVGFPATWTSSNPAAATVSATGLVRGITPGTATITATTDAFTATATVTSLTAASIALSPTARTFGGIPNAPDPAPQTIAVTNTGGAALFGLAVGTITYSGGPTDWLTTAFDRTTAPATLTLTASVAGIGVGNYGATVPVTSPRAPNSPQLVTVSFAVAAGAAAQMTVLAGDGQSAVAGATVGTAPAVLVRDQYDNPVPGVAVAFNVVTGGGNIAGPSATTGADGVAAVGSWTLGTTAGGNSLRASTTGLPDVVFNATGVPGNAFAIAGAGGDGQVDTVGATLNTPYRVRVADDNDNGVAGVTVGWAVPAGEGSFSQSTVTDASGIATAVRVLGTTAGAQTATAAVGGLQGSPVEFTATANAGTAVSITLNAGGNQFATASTAVAVAPSVIVRDGFGNPRSNVDVTFTATTGDATITGPSQTTGPDGVATVGSWTVSSVRRLDTLTATAPGLAGNPVQISVRAAWGLAAHVQPQALAANCVTGGHNVTSGPPPRVGSPAAAYLSLLNANGTMTRYVTPFDTTDDGGLRTFGTLLYRLKSLTAPMPPSPNNPFVVSHPALYAMVRDWILDGARP
jgi:hypothetical protein